MKLCLTARLLGRTLKAPVNTEDRLTLKVTHLLMCICLAWGSRTRGPCPIYTTAQPETSHLCTSVMVPTAMMSVDQEADKLTRLGAASPLLGHLMIAL